MHHPKTEPSKKKSILVNSVGPGDMINIMDHRHDKGDTDEPGAEEADRLIPKEPAQALFPQGWQGEESRQKKKGRHHDNIGQLAKQIEKRHRGGVGIADKPPGDRFPIAIRGML